MRCSRLNWRNQLLHFRSQILQSSSGSTVLECLHHLLYLRFYFLNSRRCCCPLLKSISKSGNIFLCGCCCRFHRLHAAAKLFCHAFRFFCYGIDIAYKTFDVRCNFRRQRIICHTLTPSLLFLQSNPKSRSALPCTALGHPDGFPIL